MPKILIADKMSSRTEKVLKARGFEVDVKTDLVPKELKKTIKDYDGLVVRSSTKVTKDILMQATNLKIIGRAGIGVDNIDVNEATARGIVVMNTPHGNAITTAEHTIAMMFSLARRIPQAHLSTIAGKWEKSKFLGIELTGKILLLIGCGNIGSIVAEKALALKMRVIVADPFLSCEKAFAIGVERMQLSEALPLADFISVHTPLNDKTYGLIDKKEFDQMKKGVRILNCARGGIIKEEALSAALDSGKVGGAALDVFEQEPALENPLFQKENVVCTPHLGASTIEAQENVAVHIAEQIAEYLLHGTTHNALNMPSLATDEVKKLTPYLSLIRQLGGLSGQVLDSSIQSIRITYEGEAAFLRHEPLTADFLTALLSPSLSGINIVNARLFASKRGIKIIESHSEKSDEYHTLIKIEIETDHRTWRIAGTLYGTNRSRIVSVAGVPIEAEITPYMLYVENTDKPGFIGALGSLLGKSKVNIANFNLGRLPGSTAAVALLALDEKPSQAVMMQIKELSNIIQAEALEFSRL